MAVPRKPEIAVVGAGISGLATAFALQQRGAKVSVFEARSQPGGPISTAEQEGYQLETGPHTLLLRSSAVSAILDDLGLSDQIVDADAVADRRYILRNGAPLALPSGPADLLNTEVLSPAARLRLLAEPLVPRFDNPDVDETLASFVSRRLGEEVLDYLVDPFVGGIWAGEPRQLSARHSFPLLKEWEHSGGSIFLGALRSMAQKAFAKGTPDSESKPPRRLLSFPGGMGDLVKALVEKLEEPVYLDAAVTKIRRDENSWRLIHRRGRGYIGKSFDAVVLTVPSHSLPGIQWENVPSPEKTVAEISTLPYAPCNLVQLGYDRADIEHPLDGLGLLIPAVERFHLLGILFVSSMFPGRAPDGKVLLSAFVGGARQPDLAARSDEELLEMATLDIGRILGAKKPPEFHRITRWEKAIPQYEVGHQYYLDRFKSLEERLPGIFFAGNFRDSIGLPALLEASLSHGARIDESLTTRAPSRKAELT